MGYMSQFETICICGSTKYKDLILEKAKELTLLGYVVLLPLVFGHSGDKITPEQKAFLDELHYVKISMSDCIYVVNPNGYIGDSTYNEIEYAKQFDIPIIYMEEKE